MTTKADDKTRTCTGDATSGNVGLCPMPADHLAVKNISGVSGLTTWSVERDLDGGPFCRNCAQRLAYTNNGEVPYHPKTAPLSHVYFQVYTTLRPLRAKYAIGERVLLKDFRREGYNMGFVAGYWYGRVAEYRGGDFHAKHPDTWERYNAGVNHSQSWKTDPVAYIPAWGYIVKRPGRTYVPGVSRDRSVFTWLTLKAKRVGRDPDDLGADAVAERARVEEAVGFTTQDGYQCEGCDAVFIEPEPTALYECGEDSTVFNANNSADGASHRCPDCNKFAGKVDDQSCPECEEGPLEPATVAVCDECKAMMLAEDAGDHAEEEHGGEEDDDEEGGE